MDAALEAALTTSRALVGIAARSMSHLDDVTLSQYRALVVLAAHGPLRSGDLADHLGVHPSTLTRLVDRLAAKRLVSRSHPSSRREVVVALEPPVCVSSTT
jgi:DNA-binding MarR family transcriptional regulator